MTLTRIETAIARLEALVQRPRHDPPVDLAPRLAQLEASNIRLREAVSLSLRQIDAMIAGQGAEPQS